MDIYKLSINDFYDLVYKNTGRFFGIINKYNVIIVKNFYPKIFIKNLRNATFKWGMNSKSEWKPLYDRCKDYHRLHDNYPNAHVKQKFHGFYHHGWLKKNRSLFNKFKPVFNLKNFLGGYSNNKFIYNKPSEGIIARILIHHYPVGGGYQAEHIDPVVNHALIQTLIIASNYGRDYKSGGVYLNNGQKKIFIDEHTEIGDMIVMSPGYKHGVAEIDKNKNYSWNKNSGRWIIIPIFLFLFYKRYKAKKPSQIY